MTLGGFENPDYCTSESFARTLDAAAVFLDGKRKPIWAAVLRGVAAAANPTPLKPDEPTVWSVVVVADSTPFTRVAESHITPPYQACWFGEHPRTGKRERLTWGELHALGSDDLNAAWRDRMTPEAWIFLTAACVFAFMWFVCDADRADHIKRAGAAEARSLPVADWDEPTPLFDQMAVEHPWVQESLLSAELDRPDAVARLIDGAS